ncbi:hypothetical protein [Rickettsia asembonensis]|uniref:hypothetical protein n=1 Tax=Rickettsia asembonensis TaxID=1068590 RepID=UPI00130E0BCF|nr:hypothetical protein [Rickettsia asembonensis]
MRGKIENFDKAISGYLTRLPRRDYVPPCKALPAWINFTSVIPWLDRRCCMAQEICSMSFLAKSGNPA